MLHRTAHACQQSGTKRISTNGAGYTVTSCNQLCAAYAGAPPCVEFHLRNADSRCELYKATDCTYVAGGLSVYKLVADPCRTMDFVSVQPITYTTAVLVQTVGGAQFTSSAITVVIECGPNSATFTLPTVNSPYIYPLLVFDPDMPRVELNAFATDQPLCPFESYVYTHDGVSKPVSSLIQSQIDISSKPGTMITRVIPSRTYNLDTYQFYITTTAKGGQTTTTPKIELTTICNIQSTNLVEPFIKTP